MNIPSDIALGMQNRLRIFTYDCYCADSFLSGLTKCDDQIIRWQLAVDTMYRFLICGLLRSPPYEEKSSATLKNEYREYAELLAKNNPFSSAEEDAPWHYWDLCPTDLCRNLIAQHKIREMYDFKVNEEFILQLENLFQENAVAWSNKPLIKIQQ